ncbi:aspartic peptidase domain-containing protein [Scheffersomyces xylosifermentans]|uniref:aspartic peptidase domain-containing protein n=1 Tax=Scheffersomyces xylosifermentans TaxID=1304137 RepID=UPI00315D86D9
MVSILSFSRQAFLALALALLVNGLSIPQDASQDLAARDGKVFKVDFDVVRGSSRDSLNLTSSNEPHILLTGHSKRDGEPEAKLINEKTYYATNLLIGSNKQAVTTLLDTGSSDLWVVSKGASCQDSTCYSSGVYDKSTSTTVKDLGTPFHIKYMDQTSSSGTWVKDDVSFVGGPSVRQLQFADVDSTTDRFGVFGIGYDWHESTDSLYENLPDLLKNQGVISTKGYSIYLSQKSAASGTIIFGGIDKAKIQGSLVKLPVQSLTDLSVELNSVTIGGNTIITNSAPVLDSGTTLTYLSQDVVDNVATTLNATPNPSVGYIIDCDQPSDQYVSYNFDGVTIKVPYSELTTPLHLQNGEVFTGGCGLAIRSTRDTQILGDNFLRSAYVAYNLDENTISLAQVKYTTQEDIVPF